MVIFKSVLLAAFGLTSFFSMSIGSYRYLSKEDAEVILGQSVQLGETTNEGENGFIKYKCTYTASSKDIKTNHTGALYYSFEKYPDISSAQKVYADLIASNSNMEGQELLKNIGDEAWTHTDKVNFYLIIVRKENKIIRVKINQLTSLTRLDELQKIVTRIKATI